MPDIKNYPHQSILADTDFSLIEERMMIPMRGHAKSVIRDALIYGRGHSMVMFDDLDYSATNRYVPWDMVYRNEEEKGHERTKFVSGPATPPSNAKRAKLRAKRKKRHVNR